MTGSSAAQNRFSAANSALIGQADRSAVVSALARLTIGGSGSWLDPGNVYAENAQATIKDDNGTIPFSKAPDFLEYLAASSIVHCGDAWTYWGRAMDALLRGDLQTAVHLTYYAELRGAVSLLAAEGIYIGDRVNLVAMPTGELRSVTREGTHRASWKFLEEWSCSARAGELVGEVLRPGGTSLTSWVAGIPGQSISPAVSDLFSSMALDLQSFGTDRERRNAASYTPSRLVPSDLDVHSTLGIVRRLWSSLEPDSPGGFPTMDLILLSKFLMGTYGSVHMKLDDEQLTTDQVDWDKWGSWIDSVVPESSREAFVHKELLLAPTQVVEEPLLDAAFESDVTVSSPIDFIESMMARTTVLLRISTGASLQLLDDAGLSTADTRPWVAALGNSRGLWPMNEFPDDPLDLWADIDGPRDKAGSTEPDDTYGLLQMLKEDIIVLGQAERIVAWSFS